MKSIYPIMFILMVTKKKRSGRFQLSAYDWKKIGIASLVLMWGWFITNMHDVQAFVISRGMDEGTAMMIVSFLAYFANKFISDYSKDV